MDAIRRIRQGFATFIAPTQRRHRQRHERAGTPGSISDLSDLKSALPEDPFIPMSPRTKTRRWMERNERMEQAEVRRSPAARRHVDDTEPSKPAVLRTSPDGGIRKWKRRKTVHGDGKAEKRDQQKGLFTIPNLSWIMTPSAADKKTSKEDQNDPNLKSPLNGKLSKLDAIQEDLRSSPSFSSHPTPASPPAAAGLSPPPPSSHFHSSELALLKTLNARGAQPLLPSHWSMDYRFLPLSLFSPAFHPPHLSPIHPTRSPEGDFRAQHALTDLISLGSTVRAAITANLDPEPRIRHAIRKYTAWAAWDGGYAAHYNHPISTPSNDGITKKRKRKSSSTTISGHSPQPPPPCHTTATTTETHPHPHPRPSPKRSPPHKNLSSAAQGRLLAQKLDSMALQWRAYTSNHPNPNLPSQKGRGEELPCLTGFLLSSALVGIVAWHASATTTQKSVALLDFADADQDVWNAFAVALVVLGQRDFLRGLLVGDDDDEKSGGVGTSK